jgi:hypothetical protein
MLTRPALFVAGFILALRPGCGSYEPKKEPAGEPSKVRKECLQAVDPCDVGCFKRKESQLCSSCCFEQFTLCDEGKPYDIKKCETIENDVRGH